MRKKPIVGTVVGVFHGELDGTRAQLIRRTTLGYTVKLLQSKGTCKRGEILLLSATEFKMDKKETRADEEWTI